jgi:hypothetical protein
MQKGYRVEADSPSNAFYDFSKEKNPGKKVQGHYSITLGSEIPRPV